MRYALCIGINDYPGTGADLAGCVNDAQDWASALAARGYRVTTLLDADATGANIRSAIADLVSRAGFGDRITVTYSGHGTWLPDMDGDEADRRDEAICPHDVFSRGPLVDDELYSLFARRRRGARIVMISDSCHSGTVSRLASLDEADCRGRVRYLPPEAYLLPRDCPSVPDILERARAVERVRASGRPRNDVLLMAGCRDFEYSYDARFGGRPSGAFTRAALAALVELAPEADYADWMNAIRQRLPSQFFAQTPQLYGSAAQRRWPVLA